VSFVLALGWGTSRLARGTRQTSPPREASSPRTLGRARPA
jgi:hypothetical protein